MQNPTGAAYETEQQQPLAPLDTGVPATAGPSTASSVPASMSAKDAKSLKKELEKEGKHEDSTIKKQVSLHCLPPGRSSLPC